jgi:hypothetical protein
VLQEAVLLVGAWLALEGAAAAAATATAAAAAAATAAAAEFVVAAVPTIMSKLS